MELLLVTPRPEAVSYTHLHDESFPDRQFLRGKRTDDCLQPAFHAFPENAGIDAVQMCIRDSS